MAFESLSEFINMGGHGLYVWAAYAIGGAVITFNLLSPRLYRKKLIKDHQRRQRREQL
ncbi:heme exporter protein CcmD [Reinekea marina]|uniref:Heme exporter protein D n=1 Tax=Reinekea marina TaxID=1310421 RepID=A0ABV7WU20_9GAMM|nr:heme exporter protein CcmD [Reinekea marina]MDN3648898.1 heme exporter protein CcmD [Reinekea marina]